MAPEVRKISGRLIVPHTLRGSRLGLQTGQFFFDWLKLFSTTPLGLPLFTQGRQLFF